MSAIINHENTVWLARGSSKSSEERVFKQGKYYEPVLFERSFKQSFSGLHSPGRSNYTITGDLVITTELKT